MLLRQCGEALAAADSSVIHEAQAAAPEDWTHYPHGEVYDSRHHTQYFFHRHPRISRSRPEGPPEFGHFHLFLRGEGMPPGATPLVFPDAAVANAPLPRQSAPLKRGSRDELCHLAGVAIDEAGRPTRLFTTNRWVTGETWYRAEDVIRMLDRFAPAGNLPLLDAWLGALVCLFTPEIAVLHRRRDKTIADWRWRRPSDPFEDCRLEITSSCDIDLEARLAAIIDPVPAAPRRPVPDLPRMAEGWGV